MTNYSGALYDAFPGTTLSGTNWTTPDGTSGVTVNGNVALAGQTSYPAIQSTATKDITTGIWAAQLLAPTGTANSNTQFFFECIDASGNGVGINANPSPGTTWAFDTDGAATVGTATKITSTFWSTWTANDYIGLGMSGTTMTFYKATTPTTGFTEIGHVTVGGTFAKTAVKLQISAGQLTSTSTWKAIIDNVTFFTPVASVVGKVRKGSAWVSPTALAVRKGGVWVTPSAVMVRKGGAWVTPT